MKVLLVDDDIFVRAYLHHVLSVRGHEVVEASNGIEALDRLRTQEFELGVIDVVMPEMDGVALVEQMKKDYPAFPVLGISGTDDTYNSGSGASHLELMIEAGADRVLEKPFDEKEFLNAIVEATAMYVWKEEEKI